MRVALVCPYDLDTPGGVQAHVLDLATALRGRGHVVTTLGPGGADRPGHHSVGPAVRLRFNQSVAPLGLWPSAATRTRRGLRHLAPDVVHVHEPAAPWTGQAAARWSPAPAVGTFHAWSDTRRLYRAARPLLRGVVGALAVHVAVSHAAADYHAAALGVPASSFRVIPNGVEVAPFATAEPDPDIVADSRPHVLFLGRLERRKGLEQLLRAFAILKATRPDVRLLVAGDGPERSRCESLLGARVRADVTFLGRVDEDHKRRLLRSCDVFVAPNLGGESFGIVLVEALAAGRAVVASDLPGFRSVVTDGVTGRLVPPADPPALAAAVGALLDNPALRHAMAREGQQAAGRYDWSVVTAEVEEAYEQAVAPGQPPSRPGYPPKTM